MRINEMILGAALLAWAVFLWSSPPWAMDQPGYRNLAALVGWLITPTVAYGIAGMAVGLAQVASAWFRFDVGRRACAILGFMCWSYIAGGFVDHAAIIPSIAAYGGMAMLNVRTALGLPPDE